MKWRNARAIRRDNDAKLCLATGEIARTVQRENFAVKIAVENPAIEEHSDIFDLNLFVFFVSYVLFVIYKLKSAFQKKI